MASFFDSLSSFSIKDHTYNSTKDLQGMTPVEILSIPVESFGFRIEQKKYPLNRLQQKALNYMIKLKEYSKNGMSSKEIEKTRNNLKNNFISENKEVQSIVDKAESDNLNELFENMDVESKDQKQYDDLERRRKKLGGTRRKRKRRNKRTQNKKSKNTRQTKQNRRQKTRRLSK